jgi:hypothetical protein
MDTKRRRSVRILKWNKKKEALDKEIKRLLIKNLWRFQQALKAFGQHIKGDKKQQKCVKEAA